MVSGHNELMKPQGAPSTYEMVGLDCSIIMHPQVWKCSGHYDLFHDFMVDCRESKKRYRHDQVRGRWVEAKGQRLFVATENGGEEGLAETEQRALKFFNLRGKDAGQLQWDGPLVSLTTVKDFAQVLGPDAKELFSALGAVFEAAYASPTPREFERLLQDLLHRVRSEDQLRQSLFGWTEGVERARLYAPELTAPLRVALDALTHYLGHDHVEL